MTDFTFAHRDEGFDNHIDMSIRGYNHLHDDIVSLSRYFVENDTCVVDIGCSTGKTIAAMAAQNHEFAPKANYIGVEVADGFKDDMDNRRIELEMKYPETRFDFEFMDIREYDFYNCSLVTSLFTLQFMPIKDRQDTLDRIYDGLNVGGAFLFAEKILANDAKSQDMLTFTFYDYKRRSFSEADIMQKEVTIRNMLKPNRWFEIEEMLFSAGFRSIQPFWQNFLFVGAVALK